jgi:hypothetical protein
MSAAALTADRKVAAAIIASLLAVAPAACKQAEEQEAEHYQASKITPAEEEGGHPVVTLTKRGAEKIGLETEPIEKSRIPYSALLYDAAEGQPYVFVNTEELSFHREDVTVENVDGDMVDLADGPPNGTEVVTVGVPQVHGAELEFGAY